MAAVISIFDRTPVAMPASGYGHPPVSDDELEGLRVLLIGKWRFRRTGLEFTIKAVFRSPGSLGAVACLKTLPKAEFFILPCRELVIAHRLGSTEKM